jgi:predicted kinase
VAAVNQPCGEPIGPSPECVLLIGLPAAGKTTFFRRYFAATHRQLSKDLRRTGRGRELDERALEGALAAGVSVVVDNTNLSVAERTAILAVARRLGARTIGYFFDVTTRQAVARNAQRTGRERVPNVAIFTSAKRLERPALEEGFDQLFRVVVEKDGSTRVSE